MCGLCNKRVQKRSRKGPPIGISDFFSGPFLDPGGARIISARSRFRYYFCNFCNCPQKVHLLERVWTLSSQRLNSCMQFGSQLDCGGRRHGNALMTFSSSKIDFTYSHTTLLGLCPIVSVCRFMICILSSSDVADLERCCFKSSRPPPFLSWT